MSDCFDHMVDAWESYDRAMDDGYSYCYGRSGRSTSFHADPNYYHTTLTFSAIVHETEKALLLRLSNNQGIWVPRSVCRSWREHSVLVHKQTLARLKRIGLPPVDFSDDFECIP